MRKGSDGDCKPPKTAVTSISSSMPGTARPLTTRNVLAGIGPSPYASRRHFANIRLVANVGDVDHLLDRIRQ